MFDPKKLSTADKVALLMTTMLGGYVVWKADPTNREKIDHMGTVLETAVTGVMAIAVEELGLSVAAIREAAIRLDNELQRDTCANREPV